MPVHHRSTVHPTHWLISTQLAAERRGKVKSILRVLRPPAPALLVRHRRGHQTAAAARVDDRLNSLAARIAARIPCGSSWARPERRRLLAATHKRPSRSIAQILQMPSFLREHCYYASNEPLQRALGTPNRAPVWRFPMMGRQARVTNACASGCKTLARLSLRRASDASSAASSRLRPQSLPLGAASR